MRYESYRYVFPPRPKNAIMPKELINYEGGGMAAQLKLNGSNATVYTNGEKVVVMNRHGARLTGFQIPDQEILSLYKGTGGWTALNGEYMNKSKRDETGQAFNHKFVIFDILVSDGEYLVGKTLQQRIELLDSMYGKEECDKEYLFGISESVFRVRSYDFGFSALFDRLSRIDMIEGVVLKRLNSRLETSGSEQNNMKWQVKARKSTLNYKY
jgi:hypothetical protein